MKKICFLVLFLLPYLCSCNESRQFTLLGDFKKEDIYNFKSILNMPGNNFFTCDKMQSGELYKIVDSNASYYSNGKQYPFYQVAKDTSFFIINSGVADIIPSMDINVCENTLDYDIELIQKQLEVMHYHLYQCLNVILEINKNCTIYLVAAYNNFLYETPEQLLYKTVLNMVNKELKTLILTDNIKFVELKDNYYENKEAQKAICDFIKVEKNE